MMMDGLATTMAFSACTCFQEILTEVNENIQEVLTEVDSIQEILTEVDGNGDNLVTVTPGCTFKRNDIELRNCLFSLKFILYFKQVKEIIVLKC